MASAHVPATQSGIRGHTGAGARSLTGVITRLRRVLRSSVRQEFPWESFPMARVEILQRLSEEPGLGVTELAARQRLATNTVSNVVQQMVTSGLLERTERAGDRRAVNLNLTEAGTEILAAWQAANDRRVGHALERLPQSYRDAIADALPALAALAELLETDDQPQSGQATTLSPGTR